VSEEISPLGENVLPVKELPVEQEKKEPLPGAVAGPVKTNKILPMILIGIIGILAISLVSVFVYFQTIYKPVAPSPQPSVVAIISPAPSATGSSILKSVGERLGDLDKELGDTDLNNPTLVFPILNWSINFDVKKQ
jgi:hypothetical protein